MDTAGLSVLGQEQRRDEISAQDEEDVDAEEAARQPRPVQVVNENAEHGHCPQTVEERAVRVRAAVRRRTCRGGRIGRA